jgi:uncharacterized membrane protein
VTGSIDTMLLSWFFVSDLKIAAAIGLTEVATKMLIYYLHERVWNRIPLGRRETPLEKDRVNALRTVTEVS